MNKFLISAYDTEWNFDAHDVMWDQFGLHVCKDNKVIASFKDWEYWITIEKK